LAGSERGRLCKFGRKCRGAVVSSQFTGPCDNPGRYPLDLARETSMSIETSILKRGRRRLYKGE
jgi:hypothetical protein